MIYLRVPLFATIPSGMSVPTLVQMINPAHQPGASHTTCIFIHWSGCSANDDDLHTASNPVPLRIRPDRDLWLLCVQRHSWRKNLCHNLAKDDLVKIMMITRYVVKVVTTWWLLGDHLVNTWWPLGDHLVTTWWLLGDYLVTTWWLLGDHLVTTWWLLSTWWSLGDNLVTTWWLLGDYLVTTWWLLVDHLVTTWWPLGEYFDHLVTTWWLLGDHLVTTWWPLGDHLVTT